MSERELEIIKVENTLEVKKPEGIKILEIPRGLPGVGVPEGGSTGQVLKKTTDSNYATEWGEVSAVVTSTDPITGLEGINVQENLEEIAHNILRANSGLNIIGPGDNTGLNTISIDIDGALPETVVEQTDRLLVQTASGLRKVNWEDFDAGSGGAGVTSFNGRTGIVFPQFGDYTAIQVTNATDRTADENISGQWDFTPPVGMTSLLNNDIVIDLTGNNLSISTLTGEKILATDLLARIGSSVLPNVIVEASNLITLTSPSVNVSDDLDVNGNTLLGIETGYTNEGEVLAVRTDSIGKAIQFEMPNDSHISLFELGSSGLEAMNLIIADNLMTVEATSADLKLKGTNVILESSTNVEINPTGIATYKGNEILTSADGTQASADETITGNWNFTALTDFTDGIETNNISSIGGVNPLIIKASDYSELTIEDFASNWAFTDMNGDEIMRIDSDKSVTIGDIPSVDQLTLSGDITSNSFKVLTAGNYGSYIDLTGLAEVNQNETITEVWTFAKNPILLEDAFTIKDLKIQTDTQFKFRKANDDMAEIASGGLGVASNLGDAVNNIPTYGIYSEGDIISGGVINALGKTHNVIPVGATADRPVTPSQGGQRFNTTTGNFEGWNGTTWVVLGGMSSPEQTRGSVALVEAGNSGTVSGDAFNTNIFENVAPNPEVIGDSVQGFAYIVDANHTSTITGELLSFTAGDLVMWFGSQWVQIVRNTPSAVESFNSRTGHIIPEAGDYVANQITNAADTTQNTSFDLNVNVDGSFTMGAFEMYYDVLDDSLKFKFN